MNLVPWRKQPELERQDATLSIDAFADLLSSLSFQGVNYTFPTAKQEDPTFGYAAMCRGAYKSSVVVFACMDVRAKLFSEARFAFQRLRNGRPQDLWSDASLGILEKPWVGGTTGDLLYRMIQYADIAGNAYVARTRTGLALLRPDWVHIIAGTNSDESTVWDAEATVLGYVYEPGGPGSGRPAEVYLAEEVAHFAPIPDPEARFRGMSWITPVAREIMADKAAVDHKLAFFENAATPNLVVKWPIEDLEKYKQWIEAYRRAHEGRSNAYKTLMLGAGADAEALGLNFQQMDFKVTQGAGETRIAAAAGVPPVIVGLSEGLAAATYSNYGQARRRFADQTMRPLWHNAADSLSRILNVPGGSRLWYDDRDISALQEDQKDAAEILQFKATTMKTLIDAGYEPDSVTKAVDSGDLSTLTHTQLVSVQLQEPGATDSTPAVPTDSQQNGKAPVPA